MGKIGQALLALGFTGSLGVFCLWHAWRDTEWFFKTSKAAFWVELLGREGARWVYGALGGFLLFVTFMMLMFILNSWM